MTKAVPAALQHFRALAGPLRLRVTTDAEGFPVIPGRYGRIEWFDRARARRVLGPPPTLR